MFNSSEKVHKRLHRRVLRHVQDAFVVGMLGIGVGLMTGCDGTTDALAPYEGDRPLILQRVTQSESADVQWLGGRVAAVGVNRGDRAALDETLVWIRRADDDVISSHVTVGENGDDDFVETMGGIPIDGLNDGETYTVWLATVEAVAAGLDSAQVNEHTFTDTTVTMRLNLIGRSGGDRSFGFSAQISRDERLTGTQYVLSWTPENLTFRQIAIRQAATGGFAGLVWHVVTPEEEDPNITSPVVLGELPEGGQELVEFEGFGATTYTVWMVTDDWQGAFGPTAAGYAFFTILSTNFEPDPEPEPEPEQ